MSVMRRVLLVLLGSVTAVFLIGCNLFPSADDNNPSPVNTLPPPAVATIAAQTPSAIVLPATLTPTNRSLVIWLPPAVASRTETGAITLSDQIVAFNSTSSKNRPTGKVAHSTTCAPAALSPPPFYPTSSPCP
jgi:hypothetical protein